MSERTVVGCDACTAVLNPEGTADEYPRPYFHLERRGPIVDGATPGPWDFCGIDCVYRWIRRDGRPRPEAGVEGTQPGDYQDVYWRAAGFPAGKPPEPVDVDDDRPPAERRWAERKRD